VQTKTIKSPSTTNPSRPVMPKLTILLRPLPVRPRLSLVRYVWLPFVVACGGAPFGFVAATPTDAGPEAALLNEDAAPDGELDVAHDIRLGVGHQDGVGVDAADGANSIDMGVVEASNDATPDAALDVAPDAAPDAPPEAAPIEACSPITPFVFACGTNRASVSAPSQYCVDSNAGVTFQGQPAPMPPECTCDYTCRCLLAYVPQPCQGRTFNGCSDAIGAVGVGVGCR
jgi:hypothetical protein